MKKYTIAAFIIGVSILTIENSAFAQSGTRSGGFGGGGSRLSATERAELRRQKAVRQQQQARANQQRQADLIKANFKNTLVQLGSKPDGSANRRQSKLALDEAKRDFKLLRQRKASPNQIGVLAQPFRLSSDAIDRMKNTANWPMILKTNSFSSIVTKLETQIMSGNIRDTASAEDFLATLSQLNFALNSAAANRDVKAIEYAEARRFVSGLANEIRASDLVM
jgi:hypothetical protein